MQQQLGQPNSGYLRGLQRKMLMRELVTNRTSETGTVGYYMSVTQSPLHSRMRARYDGLEHGDPNLAPWVMLRSRYAHEERVTFPISMCADLYSHLLSCAQLRQDELDSSGEASVVQSSHNVDEENCVFNLSQLAEMELNDEAVNCSLKILTEQHVMKDSESGKKSEFTKIRRWIQSGPLIEAEDSSTNGVRFLPLHMRTVHLELYEMLLPNLLTFLSDICVRYQHLDQPPHLNFLYSPSGERRFFFDIRNTPYGNRLHIAQVTDFHRSVIGIPLESLVTFRNRLTMLINALKLEEGEVMRETLEKYSNRPRRLRHARPTSTGQPTATSSSWQTRFNQENRVQQHNRMWEGKGPMKTKGPPRQNDTTSTSQLEPPELNAEGDHKAEGVEGGASNDAKEENEASHKEELPKSRKKNKRKIRTKPVETDQGEQKQLETNESNV